MKKLSLLLVALTVFSVCLYSQNKNSEMKEKKINVSLPTIGILIFEGFLTNEVVAPLDVFTKKDAAGKAIFNVILIAKEPKMYESEEGLKVMPDYTIGNTPQLSVLIVPSSMNPDEQVKDSILIRFIKKQNETVDYLASHCAGAFMLGQSGVANGKKIVTYCGGSDQLQKNYPHLLVMDDSKTRIVKDGKIISSNGNLVSYIASLDLLEEMTNQQQRQLVEEELLINKLK